MWPMLFHPWNMAGTARDLALMSLLQSCSGLLLSPNIHPTLKEQFFLSVYVCIPLQSARVCWNVSCWTHSCRQLKPSNAQNRAFLVANIYLSWASIQIKKVRKDIALPPSCVQDIPFQLFPWQERGLSCQKGHTGSVLREACSPQRVGNSILSRRVTRAPMPPVAPRQFP